MRTLARSGCCCQRKRIVGNCTNKRAAARFLETGQKASSQTQPVQTRKWSTRRRPPRPLSTTSPTTKTRRTRRRARSPLRKLALQGRVLRETRRRLGTAQSSMRAHDCSRLPPIHRTAVRRGEEFRTSARGCRTRTWRGVPCVRTRAYSHHGTRDGRERSWSV